MQYTYKVEPIKGQKVSSSMRARENWNWHARDLVEAKKRVCGVVESLFGRLTDVLGS